MISSSLSSSKLHLRYNSGDTILGKNGSTQIFLENEIGLQIRVDIGNEESNIFKMRVNISHNGNITPINNVRARDLLALVNLYSKHTKTLNENTESNHEQHPSSHSLIAIVKWVVQTSKELKNVKRYLNDLLKNPHSLNVCTIDGSSQVMLAKTTVELDADIITIMLPELLQSNNKNIYLQLHTANIYTANFLLGHSAKKLFLFIKKMKMLFRIIIPPFWVGLTLYPFITAGGLNNMELLSNFLYFIMNTFVIPALLFKWLPNMIGIVLRKILLRNFDKAEV